MEDKLFTKILFNKIIGQNSQIKIDTASFIPNMFTVHYKDCKIGYFTFRKTSPQTQVFELNLFGERYNSNSIIFPSDHNTINRVFKEFLAKLGLSNQ